MAASVSPLRAVTAERRIAVVDLGSNSFRLVVFRSRPGRSFALTDEIRESVRLSAGAEGGALQPEAIARAAAAARLYGTFCRTTGLDEVIAVATSAIRDAVNQEQVLAAIRAGGTGLDARVLSAEEEARYGYLGIVNSTTLDDGHFLDIGGGSVQVGRITRRVLERSLSRPIGAVRMTEAFLQGATTTRRQLKALRRHLAQELAGDGWMAGVGGRLVGTGGTVRTLAAMIQRRIAYPLAEIHGFGITREALGQTIDELAALPVAKRRTLPGLKSDRADIILAGAVAIEAVMERVGVEEIEVCAQGLREGIFYERFLAPAEPPLFADVRRASVLNVAENYDFDRPHAEHVARLALEVFDGTARAGLHAGEPLEREWLWAASMLHDIGVVVDYHDHHKHSFYLVLNAGLPGFSHRELAMIALLVRSHRKAPPSFDWLEPVLEPGDDDRLFRLAACLRLGEQLDRGRDGSVRGVEVVGRGATVTLRVAFNGNPDVALWSAEQEAVAFEKGFSRRLRLVAA
jgi:exopolyphosphatase / guanosine-5'-triphosphate,3'-diphosphate pyrophosphatase